MRYKNILWDFDGTLLDTYPAMVEAFSKALKAFSIHSEKEEILSYMKISISKAVEHYRSCYQLPEAFSKLFVTYEGQISPERVHPFPYAREICQHIIEAGGSNFIVTHRDYTAKEYLRHHKMLELFTEIVTSENGFKRKPDPEAYEYLIEEYSLKREQTLIVGDREFEIAAAKNASVLSCLFDSNRIPIETLPDYKIHSLTELEKVIF